MSQTTSTSPDSSMATRAPNRQANTEAGMRPAEAAKTPVGPGLISLFGPLLALGVVGLGVVGIQAALVAVGLLDGASWLGWFIDRVQGQKPASWMLPVGILLAVLGLWLVFAALKPRPRKAVALQAQTGVFLRPGDVARLAGAAAADVNGVQTAHAKATRGKVTVRTVALGGPEVVDAITAAVTQRLDPLQKAPRVSVRNRGESS